MVCLKNAMQLAVYTRTCSVFSVRPSVQAQSLPDAHSVPVKGLM